MKKAALLIILILLSFTAAYAADRPVFSGSAYVTYNDGTMSFDNVYLTNEEFVQYSPRDELGRVGPAIAYLGPKRFQAGRESMQTFTPTGFLNTQYDFISGKSLYHRCHLIAHRMTSSGEYAENLFTGTSFLNLGIMSKVESQIADYISRTQNHVLYKVTPDFVDDELVCRGVIIEAMSIEDMEIRLCLYCFNVQPGIIIDYKTGNNCLAQFTVDMPDVSVGTRSSEPIELEEVETYVLNNGSRRFHKPDCKSVLDMKAKNRQDFIGTREELLEMGYKPCGECKP